MEFVLIVLTLIACVVVGALACFTAIAKRVVEFVKEIARRW